MNETNNACRRLAVPDLSQSNELQLAWADHAATATIPSTATLSAAATSDTTSALAAPTAPATPAASSAISSTEHCFHHAGN